MWDPVLPLLAETHVVVLSGMDDAATGIEQHGRDVVALLEERDLRDAVLVGHSYGGMPITVAAELAPQRLVRLVYLDAFVPRDGESAFDIRPDLVPCLRGWAVDGVIPPIDPDFLGIDTEEQAEFIRARMMPTPLRCFEDRVVVRSEAAAALPRSVVLCGRSGYRRRAEELRAEGWDYHELDTRHMAMLTAPDDLAALLTRIAAS
jgi:pimeloyl-ACP methyl ester carboxylesterase